MTRWTCLRWPRGLAAHVVLVVALLGFATLGFVGSGSPVEAATASLAASPTSAGPGDVVALTGTGFSRSARVTLTWDGSSSGLPRGNTRWDGSFKLQFTVPSAAPAGPHVVKASAGTTSAQVSVTVVARAATATATATATTPPSPTATTPPAPSATPAAPPTVPATATATATPAASSPEARVIELVNQARTQQGLVPLAVNAALTQAAQNYATTMAATNCFAHTCPPVTEMTQRAEQAGYTSWRALGENIAAGYQTPDDVFAGWMNSPGHRANILNASYREVGVGRATGGSYGIYWTQEFGAR